MYQTPLTTGPVVLGPTAIRLLGGGEPRPELAGTSPRRDVRGRHEGLHDAVEPPCPVRSLRVCRAWLPGQHGTLQLRPGLPRRTVDDAALGVAGRDLGGAAPCDRGRPVRDRLDGVLDR